MSSLNDIAFRDFLAQVDKIVIDTVGVHMDDLADFRYRDYFEDGYTPGQTARAAIRFDQGDDFDDLDDLDD